MDPQHAVAARQLVGRILTGHPEARSLLAEASHCRALAGQSQAAVTQACGAMTAARLRYEELGHRLDPRRQRPLHFCGGLVLVSAIGTGLAVASWIDLSGPLSGWMVPAAAAAGTAAWVGGAWLAALASREQSRGRLAALAVAAAALAVLLAAQRAAWALTRPPDLWYSLSVGVVAAVLDAALAVVAAAVIARIQPLAVWLARRSWRQARAAHQAAVRIQFADAEAASIALAGWLGLVRAQACELMAGAVTTVGAEPLAGAAVSVASAIV